MVHAVNEEAISVCIGLLFWDLPEGLRNITRNLAELAIFTIELQAAFHCCGL
jgi:hypothetical protein